MSDIRVGIVGLGWGGLVHVPAFRSAAGYEVVACCGQNPGRLTETGERWRISDLSTNWKEFVKRPDLDLVSIATPVDQHRAMVEEVLAAGKHLLCEKPAGLNAREVREMLALASGSTLAHAIAFEQRWLPEHLALVEAIDAGAIGAPVLVQVSRNVSMWHPSAGRVAGWKFRLDQGGGFLNAVLAHDIDLVRRLFGEPAAVCADVESTLRRNFPDAPEYSAADAEDTVALLLRLSSGALVSLSGTAASVHGSVYQFEAMGTAGWLQLGMTSGQPLLMLGRVGEHQSPYAMKDRTPSRPLAVGPTYPVLRQVRAMALMLDDWRPALGGGHSSVPTFADALRVQEVIDAARASAAGAGWVTLG